jgi:hypothetical protein
LVTQGFAITGLRVREYDARTPAKQKGGLPGITEAKNKKVRLSFQTPWTTEWAKVRFRAGDWVTLSRESPLINRRCDGLVAVVPSSEEGNALQGYDLVVVFDTDMLEAEAREGTWRIDRAMNRTSYERQMLSLMRLATTGNLSRPPMQNLLVVSGVGGDNVDSWVKMLAGGGGAMGSMMSPLGILPEGSAELVKSAAVEPKLSHEGSTSLKQLRENLRHGGAIPSLQCFGQQPMNDSQRLAVSAALGRRLTLIQGPPGTGKTHVSTCLLSLWVKEVAECWPLLCCSGSNIAVDNIAEGCIKAGLKVVRIGRPEKVSPTLEQATLEYLMKQHNASNAEESSVDWQEDTSDPSKWQRMQDNETKMRILNQADVVCATTVVAGSEFLSQMKFAALLIDEVAQATEPAVVSPLILRTPSRLVLVGDHCQLPPNTASKEAEQRGLTLSLFGRLANHGLETHFLDMQFRMHPKIAEFSSREFYDGRLMTGITDMQRPAVMGYNWPKPGCGISFVNTDGFEKMDTDSYYNEEEAKEVINILEQVLRAGEISVLDVGVVTPYSAQVRQMRQLVRNDLTQRLWGAVDLTGGLQGRHASNALEVASVDAFQGREKELIIFSAVRCNWKNKVGFLSDWRRLNVTLTRARRGIIVIGSASTLKSDRIWKKWIDWAQESKLLANPWTMQPQKPSWSKGGGKGKGKGKGGKGGGVWQENANNPQSWADMGWQEAGEWQEPGEWVEWGDTSEAKWSAPGGPSEIDMPEAWVPPPPKKTWVPPPEEAWQPPAVSAVSDDATPLLSAFMSAQSDQRLVLEEKPASASLAVMASLKAKLKPVSSGKVVNEKWF